MITVCLRLNVGVLEKGKLQFFDSTDLEIKNFREDIACDNVNSLLKDYNNYSDVKYAELRMHASGCHKDGYLIGSFKKIKLKNKGFKWIIVN